MQAATLFTEGGTKAYQVSMNEAIEKREKTLTGNPDNLSQEQLDKLKDNIKDSKNAIAVSKQYEEAAKGLGGLANIAAGAYGLSLIHK